MTVNSTGYTGCWVKKDFLFDSTQAPANHWVISDSSDRGQKQEKEMGSLPGGVREMGKERRIKRQHHFDLPTVVRRTNVYEMVI